MDVGLKKRVVKKVYADQKKKTNTENTHSVLFQ